MAKVTGIGGVFFKAKDTSKLAKWYQDHLGFGKEDFGGTVFPWPEDKSDDKGLTVWHLAEQDSCWFSPSLSPFMINYRVDNLAEMIEQLKSSGIELEKGPEEHENGSFAWIMDPEGNKVELWEPKAWQDQ